LVYLPVDIFRKRHPLEPPKGKIYIGSGNFISQGINTHKLFVKYGHVKPHHRVLDIGSGIGRMAIPFTEYLSNKGSYEGLDIVKEGVQWCQNKITPKYPNFNFTHVDLKNDLYNLSTTTEASKFKFPFTDNEFDFVFLTSVFTHMMPEDMANYLKEIHRVLKPNGTCFGTYFIIDKDQPGLYNTSNKTFSEDLGHYFLMDKSVKEANVAFSKDYLFNEFKTSQLEVLHNLPGWWRDGNASIHVDYQDIVVLKK
jgi:ubiquinone/menaquinone biosynthesis C-methylase UbiE